jgi:uncharacterized repeat protein (TIGR01451 family)
MRLLGAAALVAAIPQAYAQVTSAGTQVDNVATVTYSVGGVEQATHPTGTGTFFVDRRVNIEVTEVGGQVLQVGPQATNQALRYNVKNNTNDAIDVKLVAADVTNGKTFGSVTDNNNASTTFTYYLSGGDATFTPGTNGDTLLTPDGADYYLDSLAAGADQEIWVVAATIPAQSATFKDGDIIIIQLTGIAHSAYTDSTDPVSVAAGNSITPAYSGAGALGAKLQSSAAALENPDAIQNVYADAANAITGDGANNGQDSAYDAFEVVAADITVTKSSLVVWDPVIGLIATGNNPKAIPGAAVLYCITVENAGSSDASNVTINDPLSALPVSFIDDSTALFTPDPDLINTTSADSIRFGNSDECTLSAWQSGAPESSAGADDTGTDGNTGEFVGGTVKTVVGTLHGNNLATPTNGVTTTMFMVTIDETP